MRQLIIIGAILCSIILIIPTMLVLAFKGDAQEQTVNSTVVQTSNATNTQERSLESPEDLSVPVFRTKSNVIEEVDFEDYIVGVVASEMPADFSIEALKAQALTARTYIVKHMLNPIDTKLPEGALVTDTVIHQVYQNKEELQSKWGNEYDRKYSRILEAVQSTRGQVITYDGEPITATFFSTSNGYTENSEDYWQNEIPYLRGVESPWDTASPRYVAEKIISAQQFSNALGVQLPNDGTVGEITARTDSGRVAKVKINGKTFTGREVREALDLDSSDFRWERNGNNVVIETRGWGHGVGMSQYGADGMAKEGKSYQEIIQHYYQDVQISSIAPFITALAE
ncbi:stage II sporulation protein D [Anaerobacillus alkalidiazotrophicus]|uniref:Stage II sporulation protein D n=1 Tax=Anaerobacillus alkalidiazotrophicus TaxID=472963 RepID=A0A1S2MB01_9BACI|nr:stage II sporulation protein D [Anaerobacillus alkalidiazotrophicus]OIJ21770.1 stage II sporulation protein D [Anaerobacillus alkalidiazotrophicus]